MAELLFLEGMHARAEGHVEAARADLDRARLILSKLPPDWRPQTDLAMAGERLEDIARALSTPPPDGEDAG